MGTGDRNQNSILKGILQNGSTFNYPGKKQHKCCQINYNTLTTNCADTIPIKLIMFIKKHNQNFSLFYTKDFFLSAVRFGRVPKREKAKILAAMQSSKAKIMESRVLFEMSDERKIIDTIVRAHYDTCDYTVEKIKPFISAAQIQPKLTTCTGQVRQKSFKIFSKYFLFFQ